MPIASDQPFLDQIQRCEAKRRAWQQRIASSDDYRAGLFAPPPAPSLGALRKRAGLACGARTRQGRPCGNRVLYPSGRCKNHGGLSTKNGKTPRPV